MLNFKHILKHLIFREKANSDSFIKYQKKRGAQIGDGTYFYDVRSVYLGLNNPFNLKIGKNVKITHGVVILDHGYDWCVLKAKYGEILGGTGQVVIGNNVFIGINSIILKDVKIGDNVIIGAGSVVTKDIPSNTVAVGNPCHPISTLDEYYKKKQSVQLRDAVKLYNSYKQSHNNSIPPKELFREYFVLFELPDKFGSTSNGIFNEVLHLMDDSYDKSLEFYKNKRPPFLTYEAFCEYCEKVISSERIF